MSIHFFVSRKFFQNFRTIAFLFFILSDFLGADGCGYDHCLSASAAEADALGIGAGIRIFHLAAQFEQHFIERV